ncbi:MAG: thioredoxin fold domain-containing protein [Rhodocyclales bacterium]|nr:thioredoxin fold domain-containing protein [Rhodocyclales bacterium]
MRALICSILLLLAVPAVAQDQPAWFKESFLDMREDIAEAAKSGRRLMLYFHQDGCPYCAKLLRENFGDKAIADKTRKHFDVIAINLWGDREVTDLAGKPTTEKEFAKALRVQFTPTLLMLDEKGGTALRLNGYIPPHQFHAALDYAGGRLEKKQSFTDYLLLREPAPASGKLHDAPWLMKAPLDLTKRDGKPLLVLFEQKVCAGCDEMHAEGFPRPEVAALLQRYRAARVDIASAEALKTPNGKSLAMRDWARQLKIIYTPSFVFFDAGGREVFRVEGYLRPFHLASSLDYVASGAYRKQPEFQRFIEARAAARREKGEKIELMK